MSDPIEDLDNELRNILKDAYDISESDAETLLEVTAACMKSPATLATAATTGTVGAAVGGTVTIGTMALPAWFVGAAAGYIGGTAVCTMHNFTGAKAIDHFLRSTSFKDTKLNNDVSAILKNTVPSKSLPTTKRERYDFIRSIDWSRISA